MRLNRNPQAVTALAAVLVLVTVGCNKSVDTEKTVWVSGVVIDSVTRAPVDSAWVSGVAKPTMPSIFTDTLGAFLFSTFPFERDWLYADKQGYITDTILIENGHSDVKGLLFELVKADGSK